MAEDVQSNIRIDIDTAAAVAELKNLQRRISEFQREMAASSAANANAARNIQRNLVSSINATRQFSASVKTVTTSTEAFTTALEKNKLSMGEYFRYAGASSKSFGRLFKNEFSTIEKVARERVKTLQTQYIKLGRDANGAMKAISIRPLMLDMDSLATKTAMAAQKQQVFNQLLKQGSTNLLNFGKNTQWAGRQLMVGFTVPLTMLGTVAAKTFMQLEEQAIRFKRVYGDAFTANAETDKMLDQVKSLSKEFMKYGVTVEKTMEMAANAAASGKMGADLLAQVNQATRLAVLGGVEQEQALETTISLTNAFGIASEELAGKINFLNAVENQTVTSIEDLTIAVPKAGPVIKQLGGDVEDLAFFLTAMREGGINASEGANALKSGLASLINPTKKASDFLAGFGVNVNGIVEANKGDVKGLVVDFAKALDTLDPLNRARAIEQMFGKFQFARLSTLFKNVVAEGSQAERVMGLTMSSVAELAVLSERELKRIEDSPMYKFKKAFEDLKTSLAPVGEAFLKAVTPFLEFGTGLLKKFNELDEGGKSFVVGLTAVLGVIGPVAVMTFGLLMNGVAQVIKGFAAVRGVFQRAGSSTTTLGQQTDYMTQQQLEAAAIAASLEQVHNRLAQTFSVEKNALIQLTQAYNRAISAQAKFGVTPSATSIGKGKVAKYAKGITMVPGPKGAGDIMPAMLAPGEAVIPAKMARKYSGLISGMVADNIPGFEDGLTAKLHKSHLQGALDPNDPEVRRQILEVYPNYDQMPDNIKAKTSFSGSLVAETSGTLNQRLKGKGVSAGEFPSVWDAIDDKMLASAVAGGLDPNDPAARKALKSIEKQIGTKAAELAKKAGTTVTDSVLESATNEVLNESKKAKGKTAQVAKQLESRKKVLGDVRGRFTKAEYQALISSGQLNLRGQQIVDPKSGIVVGDERKSRSGKNPTGYKQKATPISKFGGYTSRRSMATVIDPKAALLASQAQSTTTFNDQAQLTAKTNSESRRTRKIAKDTVDGYANELERGKKKVQKAGRNLSPRTQSIRNTYGVPATQFTPEMRIERKRLAAEAKAAQAATAAQRKADARAAAAARATAAQPATQATGRGRMSGGAVMGASMAVSSAVSGLSMMGGPVGDMASKAMGPIMAISGIASIIAMLPGPIGLVVAGLAAAVTGFVMFNNALSDGTKRGLELGKSLSMTSDKLDAMAMITGQVTSTQERRKADEQQLTGESSKTRKFGMSYLDSDAGKQILKDIETQKKNGRSDAEIGKTLGRNLALAVSQGAITGEQARSIASSLGEKLKNYAIPATISGTLVNLIGPNGEKLESDPLGIRIKIQDESLKDQATQFATAMGGVESPLNAKFAVGATAAAGATAVLATSITSAAIASGSLAAGLANVWNPAGWVALGVAAVAGTVAAVEYANVAAENNELRAASVQLGVEQLSQAQGLLDSFKDEYAQRIAIAKQELAGTTNAEDRALAEQKVNDLIAERDAGVTALNAKTSVIYDQLLAQAKQMGTGEFNTAFGDSAKGMYTEGPMKVFGDQAIKDIGGMQDGEFKMMLQFGFLSEELDPITVSNLINANTASGGKVESQYNLMVTAHGTAEANQLIQLALKGGANATTIPIITEYFSKIKDPQIWERNQEALAQIANMQQEYGITIDLNTNGTEKIAHVANSLADLEDFPDPITKDVITDLYAKDPTRWGNLYNQYAAVAGADGVITKSVVVDFQASGDEAVLNAYLADKGIQINGSADSMDRQRASYMDEAQAWNVNKNDPDSKNKNGNKNGLGNPNGGDKKDPYADILKSLQNVRNASINAAGGVKELMRLFGDKANPFNAMNGIEQNLMGQGFNQEFIDMIAGADKATQKLFITTKNGKTTLTSVGRAMQNAYNAKVLGEFNKSQKKLISGFAMENKVRGYAVKLGWDYKTAVEAGRDADLQAAIAAILANKNIKNKNAEIEKTLKLYKQTLDAQKANQTNEEKFNDAMSKARERIGVKEETIDINLRITNQANNDLIESTQNQIEDYNYDIDKLESSLKPIEDAEKKINDAYDKRIEALDTVQKSNANIARQQKGQLTLADALAQGDIAAAARAAQEMQESDAQAAIENQRTLLEEKKKSDLASLVNKDGLTREQVEAKITDYKDKIFKLENDTLKPTQRLVELEERKAAALKAGYQSEKDRLDLAQSKVDNTRVDTPEYVNATTTAEGLVPGVQADINSGTTSSTTPTAPSAPTSPTVPTGATKPTGATAVKATGSTAVKATGPTVTPKATGPTAPAKNPNISTGGSYVGSQFVASTSIVPTPAQAKAALAAGYNPKTVTAPTKPAPGQSITVYSDPTKNQTLKLPAGVVVSKTTTLSNGAIGTTYTTPKASNIPAGTTLRALMKASGGYISGPGTGTSDSIPAWLSNGEYVIKASAVKNIGVENLEAMNNAPKFADGGFMNTKGYNAGHAPAKAKPKSIIDNVVDFFNKKIDTSAIRNPIAAPIFEKLFDAKQSKQNKAVAKTAKGILSPILGLGNPLVGGMAYDSVTSAVDSIINLGANKGSVGDLANNLLSAIPGAGKASGVTAPGLKAVQKTLAATRRSMPKDGAGTTPNGLLELIDPMLRTQNNGSQVYGPGTYFAKNFDASFKNWGAEYGTQLERMVMSPTAMLKMAQSKGYINLAKFKEHVGDPSKIGTMQMTDPKIQELLSQGYVGVSHGPGNMLANWILGSQKGLGLKKFADLDPGTNAWLNPNGMQKIQNTMRDKMMKESGTAKFMSPNKITQKVVSDTFKSLQTLLKGKKTNDIYGGNRPQVEGSTGGYVTSNAIMPKYFANGGLARGTDTIPAMLSPGEFVVKKYAVDNFGVDNLKAINNGAAMGSSVYNYGVSVNISSSNANPDEIARTVIAQIKQVDAQRLRGNRFNG